MVEFYKNSKINIELKLLAKKLIVNEPTEVDYEELFSYGKMTDCNLRTRLKDDIVSDMLYLNGNRKHLFNYLDLIKN